MVRTGTLVVAALMLLVVACDTGQPRLERTDRDPPAAGFVWQLPQGFPTPRVPPDNPMTPVKVALGRRLFHDPRLSGDGTVACVSCHDPARAYTDGRARAVGIHGNIHPRSSMSLTNVAYNATLGWDDPALTRLEDQARVPLFNTQPPEMGVTGREADVMARIKGDDRYPALFSEAFPEDKNPVTVRNVTYALAAFERTLISGDSPYDRWAYGGEVGALGPDARAGARLFFSRRLSCFRCHAGFNFSGPVVYAGSAEPAARFHNTGLYNEDGRGAYPAPNTGVHRHSGRDADMGKFRAPTLRNIALTAPYMHDGSVTTLEAVLDHYAVGGRSRNVIPHISTSPKDAVTDSMITGFELTPKERRQLVAFLHALTDASFVREALENIP